jgi:Spy/CpxP family protein refolding chaperone
MKIIRISALVGLLLLSLAGMAQGGGQGRGGMMGRNNNSLLGLLQRKDVQDDLALTDAEKTKITELQTKVQEDMRARMEEMRNGGGGGFDPQAMRAEFEKVNKENDKKVAAILTPEQLTRLKQIRIQVMGNSAITDKDVQKDLGLSESQVSQIKKLQEDQQAGMQSMMEAMRDGSMDRDEMRAEMDKRNKKFDADLAKVLTTDQAAKLKELGGKPLKKDG